MKTHTHTHILHAKIKFCTCLHPTHPTRTHHLASNQVWEAGSYASYTHHLASYMHPPPGTKSDVGGSGVALCATRGPTVSSVGPWVASCGWDQATGGTCGWEKRSLGRAQPPLLMTIINALLTNNTAGRCAAIHHHTPQRNNELNTMNNEKYG